jgi:hypothetical protein
MSDKKPSLRALLSGLDPRTARLARRLLETTLLPPGDEAAFQRWARENQLRDVDHPDSFYDYRGYWQSSGGPPQPPGAHFPDTYKQFGHPSFSVESQYAQPGEGGTWIGETLLPQPPLAVSHRSEK